MAANSATALASQQSIKAYVDTQITAEDLDFSGDSGTGAVDLDSQTLAISGTASEIKTVASGQSLTISLPDDVIVGNGFTVTGIGSFLNDVNFRGKSGLTSAFWDKSESSLKWNDGGQAQFGDSQDLSIYHDGSHSYIAETGTGRLHINSSQLRVNNAADDEILIDATQDTGVSLYDGANTKRFETGPAGTITVGVSTADGFSVGDSEYISVGAGGTGDMLLYHNGTNSIIDNSTGNFEILANEFRVKSKSGGEAHIQSSDEGGVNLYWDNNVRFATTDDGADVSGTGSLKIPVGTTAQRNSSPTDGDFRFNSTENQFEGYSNSAWGEIGGGGAGGISTSYQNISSTSATGIATFAVASYRSASIVLSVTQGTSYQAGRYMVIHDGTTPTVVEESAVATGSMIASFDATIGSGNLTFRATMGSSGIATVGIKVDTLRSDSIP